MPKPFQKTSSPHSKLHFVVVVAVAVVAVVVVAVVTNETFSSLSDFLSLFARSIRPESISPAFIAL